MARASPAPDTLPVPLSGASDSSSPVSFGHLLSREHTPSPVASPYELSEPSDNPSPGPGVTTGASQPYSELARNDLIARISSLESLLSSRTAELTKLRHSIHLKSRRRSDNPPAASPVPKHDPKKFDISKHSTRFIALKFAYLGQSYNGYEHANGTVTPLPTIEEVLWKALRKARLIAPTLRDGVDRSMDVVWKPEERQKRYVDGIKGNAGPGDGNHRLELDWEGYDYSKAGRTDRGVSAFGQVIGVRVRSNRPVSKPEELPSTNQGDAVGGGELLDDQLPPIDSTDLQADIREHSFDHIADEIPYVSILNSILPPSIRILAWCPSPPQDFDARFSCRERRYKYFFTNPAFCPTPGPLGLTFANGERSTVREGWLDVEAMRTAAKKLVGLHDFRNLCKIDASKQMESCARRISHADVVEWPGSGGSFGSIPELSDGTGDTVIQKMLKDAGLSHSGPKVYAFEVHGSAFLWHQVRCMVAVIFLVGQGLEQPEIIDELFDIENNPGRPVYVMADDAPLVLWDCIFPLEESARDDHDAGSHPAGLKDGLEWIYAGDQAQMASLQSRNDGKFGHGAVIGDLWSQWHEAKMSETLAGSLLDLALSQGDGTPLRRGGVREEGAFSRSQRVFDGSEKPRMVGTYVPVMKKLRMETLQQQNEKYRAGKGARQNARRAGQTDAVVGNDD